MYGKVNQKTLLNIFALLGVDEKPVPRLYAWIMERNKTADRLGSECVEWLREYSARKTGERLSDEMLPDILTVQFTLQEAANALFGGDKKSVIRALGKLEAYHVISEAHKGVKGAGSLYVIHWLGW